MSQIDQFNIDQFIDNMTHKAKFTVSSGETNVVPLKTKYFPFNKRFVGVKIIIFTDYCMYMIKQY